MSRPVVDLRPFPVPLLLLLALLSGCGESDGTDATVPRERRISLLDDPSVVGRFEPTGVRIYEISRLLGGIARIGLVHVGESGVLLAYDPERDDFEALL